LNDPLILQLALDRRYRKEVIVYNSLNNELRKEAKRAIKVGCHCAYVSGMVLSSYLKASKQFKCRYLETGRDIVHIFADVQAYVVPDESGIFRKSVDTETWPNS
jgi:hypothetical protein